MYDNVRFRHDMRREGKVLRKNLKKGVKHLVKNPDSREVVSNLAGSVFRMIFFLIRKVIKK